MSNRAEERMASNLDRSRGRDARSAERSAIRSRIATAVSLAVNDEPAELRDEAAKVAAETARTLYAANAGEVEACALYGRLAHSPIGDLHRAVARSRADQVFATEGMRHVSAPLANVINQIAAKVEGS